MRNVDEALELFGIFACWESSALEQPRDRKSNSECSLLLSPDIKPRDTAEAKDLELRRRVRRDQADVHVCVVVLDPDRNVGSGDVDRCVFPVRLITRDLEFLICPAATYDDGVDFIKKNKNVFKSLIRGISTIIIKLLLGLALKEIAKLVAKYIAKKQAEKMSKRKAQILSLVGVSAKTLINLANSQI